MGQALRSSRPSEAEIEARLEAALAKRRATLAVEREKAPLPVAVERERASAYTYTPPNLATKEATDFQMVRGTPAACRTCAEHMCVCVGVCVCVCVCTD